MGIPDHLTCLLRNIYAGQEATVRTGQGTMDWFLTGKGVHQGCILPSCLFNLYAESVVQNARLHEAQAGIKIAGRNINNLRYADDTTLMAENEEELKSLLMKVKGSKKAGLKLNIRFSGKRPELTLENGVLFTQPRKPHKIMQIKRFKSSCSL